MKLDTTPKIRELISAHQHQQSSSSSSNGSGSGSGSSQAGHDWIEHSFLVKIYNSVKSQGKHESGYHVPPLVELLEGTGVYTEPPDPAPVKSKEYIALMARLEREQQEREYNELLGNRHERGALVAPGNRVLDSLNNSELKAAKEQVSTIVNILVSALAVAWAAWIWTNSWSLAARTLASLFSAIVTLVAEVVLYWGYKSKVEAARAREQAINEKHAVPELSSLTGKSEQQQQVGASFLPISTSSSKTTQMSASPVSSHTVVPDVKPKIRRRKV